MHQQLLIATVLILFINACQPRQSGDGSNATSSEDTVSVGPVGRQFIPADDYPAFERPADSILFVRGQSVVQDRLRKNRTGEQFNSNWEIWVNDSVVGMQAAVRVGHFFEENKSHALVTLSLPWVERILIFEIDGQKISTQGELTTEHEVFISDTIFDVNGDRYVDYISNWYGKNGCCLKAFSSVFIYRPQSGSFSEPITFINPNFSPNDRMVRGIEYGHPMQTDLYKFRWNGESLDSIELLHFVRSGPTQIDEQLVREKYYGQTDTLAELPLEYHSVEDIAWFLGEFHDGPYNAHNNHFKSWQSFVPEGFNVLDRAEGDMNMDGKEDLVLLLKNDLENIVTDTTRPILLLAGNGRKGYRLLERAERVAMCLGCGGVYGDPHERLVVGKGYFAVEHRGGSGWRWTRTNRFKYDKKRKRFILDNDRVVSWHVSEPEKTEERWHHSENFGTQTLRDYNYDLFK